jgi:hypothetical protein
MFYFNNSRYASASTKNHLKKLILGVAWFCWGNGCTHQPNGRSMQLVDAGRCSSAGNRGNTGDSVHRPSVASTSHTLRCLHARLNSRLAKLFPFSDSHQNRDGGLALPDMASLKRELASRTVDALTPPTGQPVAITEGMSQ